MDAETPDPLTDDGELVLTGWAYVSADDRFLTRSDIDALNEEN